MDVFQGTFLLYSSYLQGDLATDLFLLVLQISSKRLRPANLLIRGRHHRFFPGSLTILREGVLCRIPERLFLQDSNNVETFVEGIL